MDLAWVAFQRIEWNQKVALLNVVLVDNYLPHYSPQMEVKLGIAILTQCPISTPWLQMSN